MTRKRFTRDFKLMVLRELDSGKTATELSRVHEVHPNVIQRWRCEYRDNPKNAFAGPGNTHKLEAKLAERDRIIGKLYAENELLKKAIANLKSHHMGQRRRTRTGGSI